MLIAVVSAFIGIFVVMFVNYKVLSSKVNIRAVIAFLCALVVLFPLPLLLFPESAFQFFVVMLNIFFTIVPPLFIFRDIKRSLSAYISILILGLSLTFSASTGWILFVITNETTGSINDFIANSALLVLCLAAYKTGLLSRAFQSIIQLSRGMKTLFMSSLWVSAMLVYFFSHLFSVYSDMPLFILAGVSTVVLVALVGVMYPLLITYSVSSSYYRNLSDLMDQQVQAQVTHYETMSVKNEDIRRFQHDYKNLRLGLVDYLKRDDAPGALSYLETDEMSLNFQSNSFASGSVILDALLSEKQVAVAGVNTSVVFDGIVPGNMISPADICVIFGNVLDNAIEACAKCPGDENKTITIKAEISHGHLFISVENPIAGNVNIVNNTIATSKENKRSHGLGLQSMKKAVEKYSGDVKLSCENGVFCTEIVLYLGQYQNVS